jgi:hypothetical protein
MFRSIVAWLNKRWPEVVTVTKQDYTELRQEVAQLNQYIQALTELNSRLVAVEGRVKELSVAQGFVNTAKGSFKLER